ncbi:hypothetical protein [Haliscomenobacter sp.]|uniref:hypothetical protein n=1 Tax=Haliscomenobacter sp. TaxID=2717303 RepID=UPI0033652196
MKRTHAPLFEIRPGDSFIHAREIRKPFGELDRVLAWCKTELTGEWRWQLVSGSTDQRPGRYIFYFDSERDHFAFTLYWQ